MRRATAKPVRKGEPYVTPVPKPRDPPKHKPAAKTASKKGKKG